ncbi:MAG: tetratricopeptide repeat protein [Oligoflexales bacterium]
MSEQKQSINSFLSSFLLLIVALFTSYSILLIYRPETSESFKYLPAKNSTSKKSNIPNDLVDHERMQHLSQGDFAQESSWPSSVSQDGKDKQTNTSKEASLQSKSPSFDPTEIESLLSDAMNLVDQGNHQAAAKILEKILEFDPRNEMALVEMGMIQLIDLKSPQNAIYYLQSALRVNPSNRVVLSELVGIYDELGQSGTGLNYLQQLYEETSENTALASGIGQVLAGQGRLQEALPYLEKSAEDSQSGVALTDLADAYSQTGNKEKSLETYQKVIDLERERVESGYYTNDPKGGKDNLAMAYMDKIAELIQQNKHSEAEDLVENKVKNLYGGDLRDIAKLFEKNRSLSKR